MSQYIKLLQHNGGFISVLADDNGVIQYTTNDADYADIPAASGNAATATAPEDATTFTAALNQSTTALKGLQSSTGAGLEEKKGTDLTDANQTITPGTSKCSVYFMRPNTVTAPRTITLGTAGCSTGDIVIIVWQDLGAFTCPINNGAGSGIASIAGSTNGQAKKYQFYFTAGDWIFNAAEWVNT